MVWHPSSVDLPAKEMVMSLYTHIAAEIVKAVIESALSSKRKQ